MTTATTRRRAKKPDTVDGQITLHASAPVDRIDPHPDNIRHDLGDLTDLAESIKTHGVIEPLIVFPAGDRWTLIAGHRRLAAAQLAGRVDVPILERAEPDRADLLELMLHENNQRADLDPIDEGRALVEIMAAHPGRKLDDLARAVCRSKTWVSERVAIATRLDDPKVHDRIRSGALPLSEAAAIASAKGLTADERIAIAKEPNKWQREQAITRARWEAEERAAVTKAKKAYPGRTVGTTSPYNLTARPDGLARWGVAKYGDQPGNINVPPEMGDAARQYVWVRGGWPQPSVFHLSPELLDPADFVPYADDDDDGPLDADVVELHDLSDDEIARAVLVEQLPMNGPKIDHWQRTTAHRACAGHREVSVPWQRSTVAVCVEPLLHDVDPDADDGRLYGPAWPDLLDLYRKAVASGEARPVPNRPTVREQFGPERYDQLLGALVAELTAASPLLVAGLLRLDCWDVGADLVDDADPLLVEGLTADRVTLLARHAADSLVTDWSDLEHGDHDSGLMPSLLGARRFAELDPSWPSDAMRRLLDPPTLEDFLGAVAAACASDEPVDLADVSELRQLASEFTDAGWTVDVEADESEATFTAPGDDGRVFVVRVPEATDAE